MTDDPSVTVVVPLYNKQRFVLAALESVRTQTLQDFDLIVVDDCSTDGSARAVESWISAHGCPCRFVQHETNQGLPKGLNDALGMARGRYFSVLSADDLWRPRFLERLVQRMDELPEGVAVAYCDSETIDAAGDVNKAYSGSFLRRYPCPPEGQVFRDLVKRNFISANAVLTRTECLRAVGGWDEDIYTEDLDMWLRLAHRHSFVFVPETLAEYRVLPGSASHSGFGRLRMGQSIIAIREKWRGLDVSIDEAFEEALCEWSPVEALYASGDRAALRYGLKAFERGRSLRGLVMLGFMALRLPHSAYWVAKSWARTLNGKIRKDL